MSIKIAEKIKQLMIEDLLKEKKFDSLTNQVDIILYHQKYLLTKAQAFYINYSVMYFIILKALKHFYALDPNFIKLFKDALFEFESDDDSAIVNTLRSVTINKDFTKIEDVPSEIVTKILESMHLGLYFIAKTGFFSNTDKDVRYDLWIEERFEKFPLNQRKFNNIPVYKQKGNILIFELEENFMVLNQYYEKLVFINKQSVENFDLFFNDDIILLNTADMPIHYEMLICKNLTNKVKLNG